MTQAVTVCGWLGERFAAPDALASMQAGAAAAAPAVAPPPVDRGASCALAGDHLARDGDLQAALAGRVVWRDDRWRELAASQGPARTLLAAFRRDDSRAFAQLGGPFCAVVLDGAAGRVVAAVDRLGQRALYFTARADGIAFADDAAPLLRHPGVDAGLSLQGLYHYLYFHMLPSPGSIYQDVGKLPGGHLLDYRLGEPAPRLGVYWRPSFDHAARDRAGGASAELGERLRRTLRGALARQLDGVAEDAVGAFLSGGLDSSTVAGLLAGERAGAPTFSIGFDAEGYDEIPYARISAQHFGTRQVEYYVTPDDVVEAIPTISAGYAEPFGNSSAIPTYYCARLAAEHGITRLLAGDGGDELFAGNKRYAKQQTFELYYGLPGPLRGLLDAALPRLPGLPLAGKLKSYARQAQVPLPDRLQTYNYLHRIDPAAVLSDEMLAAVDRDQPLRLLRERYREPDDASTLDRMLYLDWQFTLADNDLRKVNRTCALNGVEVAYPFLDDEVVAFSCSIPDRLKLKGNRLRHFYKQAMQGFLPEQVLTKSKHGFGLPFGVWMRTYPKLQQLAYDNLHTLRGRGYFRPAFIDQAIELHRGGHAGYYGELIWVLTMLELWLGAHQTPPARRP